MSRARQVDPEPKVDLTVTFPGEFMASSGRMLRFEDNVAIWDDNLLEEIGDIMVAGVATASPSVSSPSVASEEPIEAAPTTVAEDLDAPPPVAVRAQEETSSAGSPWLWMVVGVVVILAGAGGTWWWRAHQGQRGQQTVSPN